MNPTTRKMLLNINNETLMELADCACVYKGEYEIYSIVGKKFVEKYNCVKIEFCYNAKEDDGLYTDDFFLRIENNEVAISLIALKQDKS